LYKTTKNFEIGKDEPIFIVRGSGGKQSILSMGSNSSSMKFAKKVKQMFEKEGKASETNVTRANMTLTSSIDSDELTLTQLNNIQL
jgi:hypothetical protein